MPDSPFQPTIYAVIVNWNRADDTLECLESLARQEGVQPHIIVVDNGSMDGSVARIQAQYPQVEVLCSPTNLGFGRGNNLGICEALQKGADWIFLMNNDALLAPDGLLRLLKQAGPGVGALAPLIYYAALPDRIWSIGGLVHPWTLEVRHEGRGAIDMGDWPEILERDFVTGCGVLFSRPALEQAGLFDESFHMYYEDSDLCRRVRRAGLRILVVPRAHMWHKVSLSSGGNDSPNERYWMARSSVLFFRKHARGGQILVIIPYRLGSAIRISLRLLRGGRGPAARAYWRGLRDGLADAILKDQATCES